MSSLGIETQVTGLQLQEIIEGEPSDSFEHMETTYVDNGDFIVVTMTFRGNNSFGALDIDSISAEVTLDGKSIKLISE